MTLPGRDDDGAECLEARGLRWGSMRESPVLATRGATCVGYPAPPTPLVPHPWDPFKCPTVRRPDPQELLELLFYRGDPRGRVARVFDTSLDPSLDLSPGFPTVISPSSFPILLHPIITDN